MYVEPTIKVEDQTGPRGEKRGTDSRSLRNCPQGEQRLSPKSCERKDRQILPMSEYVKE